MRSERGFLPPKEAWYPGEINKPHKEEFTLENFSDAILVNNIFIVAYKHMGGNDKVFIGRERTVPIKIEITGREKMFPYPNERELKGKYGVLIFNVLHNPYQLAVGRDYRVTLERSFTQEDKRLADINIESTKPIKAKFIDGELDYNETLTIVRNFLNSR